MNLSIYADLLLRGASMGILALLLARLLMQKPLRFVEASFAALVFSLIIYVIVSSPTDVIAEGIVRQVLVYIPVLTPFLLWWAGQAFFDDEFAPRAWHLAPAVLVVLPVAFIGSVQRVELLRTAVIFLLYAHLIVTVIKSRSGDLVEERRRFRRWFIVFTVALGVVIEFAEVTSVDHRLPQAAIPYHAGAIFMLTAAFGFWSLRISGPSWQPRAAPGRGSGGNRPADARLLQRLQAEMDAGAWRTEGLSVGELANRLGVPEHQVRRSINSSLGYRNFPSFVNERRIAEACTLLADPEQAGKSVLAVAYEVGFSSIGPFNRAFRSIRGESPTMFRNRELGKAG